MSTSLARIRLTCASFTVVTDNDSQTLSEKDTLIVTIRATVSSEGPYTLSAGLL